MSVVSPKLQKSVDDLCAVEAGVAEGKGTQPLVSTKIGVGVLTPFKSIKEVFSRAPVYAAAAGASNAGQRVVAELQAAELSRSERDVHMRYRSRVRMVAHVTARAHIGKLADGPVSAGLRFVKLIMDAEEA